MSGAGQSAPMHARIPGPIRVRLADGAGQPLAGRTVTMVTTRVTAPQYSFVTDAMGEVTFPDVRAGLPLGPETITFRSLGVGDRTATVIATEPSAGTIFTVLNGARNDRTTGIGGPTYDATSSGAHTGRISTQLDGTIYVLTDERVLRITPEGRTEWVVAQGCCGLVFPTGSDSIDALTEARIGGSPIVAVDPGRPLLYVAQQCGIYQVDLVTRRMTRFVGANNSCGYTGDEGASTEATAGDILSIAVNDEGLVYFVQNGISGFSRALRYVDRSGAIHTILRGQTGPPALSLGFFLTAPYTIPGSTDVLFSTDCTYASAGYTNCLVRTTIGGTITRVAGGWNASNTAEGIPATSAQLGPGSYHAVVMRSGEILVSEYDRHRVRRIDLAGNITTIAGTFDTPGTTGDGGPGAAALLRNPGLMMRWRGDHVLLWEQGNRTLRSIW